MSRLARSRGLRPEAEARKSNRDWGYRDAESWVDTDSRSRTRSSRACSCRNVIDSCARSLHPLTTPAASQISYSIYLSSQKGRLVTEAERLKTWINCPSRRLHHVPVLDGNSPGMQMVRMSLSNEVQMMLPLIALNLQYN
jgi:hypothetical protein